MGADDEDGGVIIEGCLCAVAMVNVKIKDQHLRQRHWQQPAQELIAWPKPWNSTGGSGHSSRHRIQ